MKKEHIGYIHNKKWELIALKNPNPKTLEELHEFNGTTEQKWQLEIILNLDDNDIFSLERICKNEIKNYGVMYMHSKQDDHKELLEEWEFKLTFVQELLEITDIGEKTKEKNRMINQKNREYHEDYIKKQNKKRAK